MLRFIKNKNIFQSQNLKYLAEQLKYPFCSEIQVEEQANKFRFPGESDKKTDQNIFSKKISKESQTQNTKNSVFTMKKGIKADKSQAALGQKYPLTQEQLELSELAQDIKKNSFGSIEQDLLKDEDVHSKRLIEQQKLITKEDTSYSLLRNEMHRFIFDIPMNTLKLNLDDINILNIENEETFHRTPQLAHNLDIILQKPGVFPIESLAPLQEDGGKFLRFIPQPEEIDFKKIPDYTPPSKDKLLHKFAKESNIKYVMSTSTISSVLSQIYYLLSNFKNPEFKGVFDNYENEPRKFMISQRKPVTNFIRKVDQENNIYGLDSDSGIFKIKHSILMELGKVIERSITLSPEVFRQVLLKNHSNNSNLQIEDDHHRFMKLNNDICLRSQIDCYSIDPKTKQPFVFEIKSRSVCPIRYDIQNYVDYLDYTIQHRKGLHSSFEREYYDLIRGSFLKWSFQLKIGRMDGAFVAFHNTREMFGFEYIKSYEIERRVFGSELYADVCFQIGSKILVLILDSVLKDLKNENYQMLKLGTYSCSIHKKMYVFAELYEENIPWGENELVEQNDEIKDEIDYFTKIKPFQNKVYKYELFLYPYVNGVLQKGNFFNFSKGDTIDIRYKFQKIGKAQFYDYMNFLHDAYKLEAINLELAYSGTWIKSH